MAGTAVTKKSKKAVTNRSYVNQRAKSLEKFLLAGCTSYAKHNMNGQNVVSIFMEVTPDIASEMLTYNEKNRKVSQSTVKFLAKEIRNRRYIFNGESIKFDAKGFLIDGQHRLIAIVETGITVSLHIFLHIEKDAIYTIDTGKKRIPADVLSIEGCKEASKVSGAIKLIDQFEKGRYGERGSGTQNMTILDVVKFWRKNPNVEDIVIHIKEVGTKYQSRGLILPSIFAAFYFICGTDQNKDKVVDFIDKFYSGANLDHGSPILALRNKMIKAKESKNRFNLTQSEVVKSLIVAWNAYLLGNDIQSITIKDDQDYVFLIS